MDTSRGINWVPATFIVAYHVALLVGLPLYFWDTSLSWTAVWGAVALFWLTGIAITAGYHRYFSHKSYKTNRLVECILLFFGSMAAQGSVLRWAFDHRLHHAHTDGDNDPYAIQRGFWYAHILWIFEKPRPIQAKVVADLLQDPLVVWQDRLYALWMVGANALPILALGWYSGDYWGVFWIVGLVRIALVHHFTWFINSLAHTWGEKPFSQEQSAVDNFILSILTFGEGYHNYHHTYANDYRNGVRWFHFDPTKWVIWLLSLCGMAQGLRRMDHLSVKKKLVLEGKNLLSERLAELWYVRRDEVEKQIQEVSDRLLEQINHLRELHSRYRQFKVDCVEKTLCKDLYKEIRDLKRSMRTEWRQWRQLSRRILHLKPLPAC